MGTIIKHSVFIQKTNTTLSTNMDGETVILDITRGKYYGLDDVGARVWEILQSAQTLDQIKAAILEEYNVDEQQCETDLIELLTHLHQAELIETQ